MPRASCEEISLCDFSSSPRCPGERGSTGLGYLSGERMLVPVLSSRSHEQRRYERGAFRDQFYLPIGFITPPYKNDRLNPNNGDQADGVPLFLKWELIKGAKTQEKKRKETSNTKIARKAASAQGPFLLCVSEGRSEVGNTKIVSQGLYLPEQTRK